MIEAALGFLAPYRLIIIGMAILSAVVFIDRRATYRERAKCDAAAMRAERDAALQDLSAEKIARAAEKATIENLEKQKETDDEARQSLEAELAKRPAADRCPLSADDAKRVR